MKKRREADVLIIGGGAIGVCSAHYLSAQGLGVILVEKGAVCSGCSGGNGGLIVPSYSIPLASPGKIAKGLKWMFDPESPFAIKPRPDPSLLKWLFLFQRAAGSARFRAAISVLRDLNMAGLALFEALDGATPLDFGLEHKGFLAVYTSPHGRKEGLEEARLMAAAGIPAEMMGKDEIAAVTGGCGTRAAGGVFYPKDAHLDPRRFVTGLAAGAASAGAKILESTEVIGFETAGRRITAVQTTRGKIRAREIVLAGGAWSSKIVRDLKIDLPMQPAKGYSITYERTEKCPAVPVGLLEAKAVLTPLATTFRIAGTMEFAGFDRMYQRRRIAAVERSISAYFPEVDPSSMAVVEIWQGFRPCSPDGLPYLGRMPGMDNLIVAAGHGMLGITQAPISGKIVSELASGRRPSLNIAPFRPDRFRRKGNNLVTGHKSGTAHAVQRRI